METEKNEDIKIGGNILDDLEVDIEIEDEEELSASHSYETSFSALRQDSRSECALANSSLSASPINSPARHSQHYRTLQSNNSNITSSGRLSTSSTPSHYHQRSDSDFQTQSKRWHTAPKEKPKVF